MRATDTAVSPATFSVLAPALPPRAVQLRGRCQPADSRFAVFGRSGCEPGRYSDREGATVCSACYFGYWSGTGQPGCWPWWPFAILFGLLLAAGWWYRRWLRRRVLARRYLEQWRANQQKFGSMSSRWQSANRRMALSKVAAAPPVAVGAAAAHPEPPALPRLADRCGPPTLSTPLPAPSGAKKKSIPRGAPMRRLALRPNPERSKGHVTALD